jgi:hypothetical protein
MYPEYGSRTLFSSMVSAKVPASALWSHGAARQTSMEDRLPYLAVRLS